MTRRETTLSGRCFKALFGIPSGPGALPTLRPLMVSWTSVGLVSLGLLAGARNYARITTLTISVTAGTDGSFTGWNWASNLSTRASAFSESERGSPPGVTRGGDGVGILITHLVIFHSDLSSGSRLSSMLLHWSFLHSLSWLVTELWRWSTSAFRVESLVICHCLLNGFSGVFLPEYKPASGAVGHLWATLGLGICQRCRDSIWL